MKSLLLGIIAATSILAVAQGPLTQSEKAAKRVEFEKKYYANTGGRVVKPDSGEGEIIIYNAQKQIHEETLAAIAEHITITLAMRVSLKNGEPVGIEAFDAMAKAAGGGATVFMIESSTLPLSLVAYDNGWGMVNAAMLAKSPADKVKERTEKELTRTICLTCGIASGAGVSALMLPVRNIEALDNCELPNERGNPMVAGALHNYMLNFGVTPVTVATYRKACSDGWAPKPKDDVQRALWETTQEKKERLAVNGLKILPKGKKE